MFLSYLKSWKNKIRGPCVLQVTQHCVLQRQTIKDIHDYRNYKKFTQVTRAMMIGPHRRLHYTLQQPSIDIWMFPNDFGFYIATLSDWFKNRVQHSNPLRYFPRLAFIAFLIRDWSAWHVLAFGFYNAYCVMLLFRRHSSPPDLRNGLLVEKDGVDRSGDTCKDTTKEDDFRICTDVNGNFLEEDEDRWKLSDEVFDELRTQTQGIKSEESTASKSGGKMLCNKKLFFEVRQLSHKPRIPLPILATIA